MAHVTHEDIALAAGVSKATVSLALRGHPKIPELTRKKILETATRLGYVADPWMRSLARHRWQSDKEEHDPVVVFLHGQSHQSTDPFAIPTHIYGRHYHAVELASQRLGYKTLAINFRAYSQYDALNRMLVARGLHEIVLAPVREPTDILNKMQWDGFHVVSMGGSIYPVPFHKVDLGVFQSIKLVMHTSCQRGYRRIGLALPRHGDNDVDFQRRMGAYLILQQETIPVQDRLAPHIMEAGAERIEPFTRWINEQEPDVVIGLTGLVGYWMTSLGFTPERCGFVSLVKSDVEPEHYTSIVRNDIRVAEVVLKTLAGLREASERGIPKDAHRTTISPEWFEGNTLPYKGICLV
ncbi:MAG: LacI family DNA-binding transcriptional regulator [Verrucomicrobiota bacterium]|nr:LacI family DNA-binding transcriptional regulator [Verrucomicrobiota bacterium]